MFSLPFTAARTYCSRAEMRKNKLREILMYHAWKQPNIFIKSKAETALASTVLWILHCLSTVLICSSYCLHYFFFQLNITHLVPCVFSLYQHLPKLRTSCLLHTYCRYICAHYLCKNTGHTSAHYTCYESVSKKKNSSLIYRPIMCICGTYFAFTIQRGKERLFLGCFECFQYVLYYDRLWPTGCSPSLVPRLFPYRRIWSLTAQESKAWECGYCSLTRAL